MAVTSWLEEEPKIGRNSAFNLMLPKIHRLTIGDFNKNNQKPQRFHSINLTFFIKTKKNSEPSGFSISVPKYLDKRSVYRHQTKRMISQFLIPELREIINGYDILIKPKRIFSKKEGKLISEEIYNLLHSAKLIT
ncbi:ribonuclease P protein component [Patescibacteria group bacterium]|nr:ribonuclease P protein component [Patescibacteria group bacterium]MCL5797184.1 ribonuclease P protein component [Patescibacteria group bacterium]